MTVQGTWSLQESWYFKLFTSSLRNGQAVFGDYQRGFSQTMVRREGGPFIWNSFEILMQGDPCLASSNKVVRFVSRSLDPKAFVVDTLVTRRDQFSLTYLPSSKAPPHLFCQNESEEIPVTLVAPKWSNKNLVPRYTLASGNPPHVHY